MLVFETASVQQIADACDAGVRSVYRWKQDADFRAYMQELQSERDEQARRESAGLMADAAAVIRAGLARMSRMLDSEDVAARDASSIVQAAHAVLKTTSAQVGPVERSEVVATVRASPLDVLANAAARGVDLAAVAEALDDDDAS